MNKASGHESHQCEKKKEEEEEEQRVRRKSTSGGQKKQGRWKEEGKVKREKERVRVRVGNVKSFFLSQSAAHRVLSVAMFILN